ncbi:hypothetical protein D3C72_1845790 [compost metagenome]
MLAKSAIVNRKQGPGSPVRQPIRPRYSRHCLLNTEYWFLLLKTRLTHEELIASAIFLLLLAEILPGG